MPTRQDIVTNMRRLSVQAGVAGGALEASLGAYQVASGVHVPAFMHVIAGALTAAGVFFGRLIPQPKL
jgi:hypothetical protein